MIPVSRGDSTPGYIEVRDITFNTTNRSAQGGAPTDGTRASGGTGQWKPSKCYVEVLPGQTQVHGCILSGRPGQSPRTMWGFKAPPLHILMVSFSLAEFGNVSDFGAPAPQARGLDIFYSSRKRRKKCKFYSIMFAILMPYLLPACRVLENKPKANTFIPISSLLLYVVVKYRFNGLE